MSISIYCTTENCIIQTEHMMSNQSYPTRHNVLSCPVPSYYTLQRQRPHRYNTVGLVTFTSTVRTPHHNT